MSDYRTNQEHFWTGAFGDEYTDRNQGDNWISSNIALFSKVLSNLDQIESVIELGANRGLNLRAIRQLLPAANLTAVEINKTAVSILSELGYVNVHHASILDFLPDAAYDLTLIKGLLIHVNPEALPQVYDLLYKSSNRYICVAEYYNPTPVEILYRGHTGKLYKRDFAGEILDRFIDLKLVDYGFVYHRDTHFPQDDITWFVLEKSTG